LKSVTLPHLLDTSGCSAKSLQSENGYFCGVKKCIQQRGGKVKMPLLGVYSAMTQQSKSNVKAM